MATTQGSTAQTSTQRKWLTVADAAKQVQCGRRVIYKAIQSGALRAAAVNDRGDLRLSPAWLDAWLETLATPTGSRKTGEAA